jgi:hypothetical protein
MGWQIQGSWDNPFNVTLESGFHDINMLFEYHEYIMNIIYNDTCQEYVTDIMKYNDILTIILITIYIRNMSLI